MRNLATIQEIIDVQPIEGKDRIVLATVLGWQVIVRKEEMGVGDKVVYVEIDSVLPDKPEYEDIKKRSNLRIKTMKMAGVISQGICFPLSVLPEGNYKVGDDVTGIIGVTKYDSEAEAERRMSQNARESHKGVIKFMMRFAWFRKLYLQSHKNGKKSFPAWIKKTDETRLQNMPNVLRFNDIPFIVTEKLDGCSGTYAVRCTRHPIFRWKTNYEFFVCSRNMRLPKSGNHYWRVAEKFNIEEALTSILRQRDDVNYVIMQGEILASNVQGNKYGLNGGDVDFYAFNLMFPDVTYNTMAMQTILSAYDIKTVLIVDNEFTLLPTVPEMVEYATDNSMVARIPREGVVIRNNDKNISFKVINPKFLLKYDA